MIARLIRDWAITTLMLIQRKRFDNDQFVVVLACLDRFQMEITDQVCGVASVAMTSSIGVFGNCIQSAFVAIGF